MSPHARPVIGITCYVEDAAWGVWQAPAALVPYAYVRRVTAAGARAVVIPPDDVDADLLGRLDGLLLAGGADVTPDQYGESAHPRTVTRPDRDAGELALLGAALDADLPVLGVCRGMQLLAVAAGGSLHQHLPELVGHERHQPAPGRYGEHPVTVAAGSTLHTILGPTALVNSYHHQAVRDPGSLVVTARSDDGVIEAVEDPRRRFVLGVQWHPEELTDPRLFEALAGEASAGATRRAALRSTDRAPSSMSR
ncbi:gamma-glutamyl-gamma-aminobutyrate hydrolase family protein [Rugosimonospora acidiphila]|uniref:Gamma-glutamyl-gamma-aminobutyrate hydrolase family protein n=1 Tax=Rugosimonospora acidiphila TaxID=556531 RepID=A0ABP9RPL1_9ACTN